MKNSYNFISIHFFLFYTIYFVSLLFLIYFNCFVSIIYISLMLKNQNLIVFNLKIKTKPRKMKNNRNWLTLYRHDSGFCVYKF